MDASILTTLVSTVVMLGGMLVITARLKADLKAEIKKLRTGLKGSIQDMHTGLKGSIQGLSTGIQDMHTGLKGSIQGLNAGLQEATTDLEGNIQTEIRQMDDRLRRLNELIILHQGPAPFDLPSPSRTATRPPSDEAREPRP